MWVIKGLFCHLPGFLMLAVLRMNLKFNFTAKIWFSTDPFDLVPENR